MAKSNLSQHEQLLKSLEKSIREICQIAFNGDSIPSFESNLEEALG